MRRVLVSLAFASLVVAPRLDAAERVDPIVVWNRLALEAVVADGKPAAAGLRTLAIMHAAQFDAVQGASASPTPLLAGAPAAPGADAHVAAIAAAHAVLNALHPGARVPMDAAFNAMLGTEPCVERCATGRELGEAVAKAWVDARADDGARLPDESRPETRAGVYIGTQLTVLPNASRMRPMLMSRADELRPGPPVALDSEIWARDYEETARLGAIDSASRAPQQAQSARFWMPSGLPFWNDVARQLATARPRPLPEQARLFAQLNLALYDAILAVFEAKHHYLFWRPVTAIRNGDRDGNAETTRIPAWRPLLDTPPFSEYPCAHCTGDGAAGAVLRHWYGDGKVTPFTLHSDTAPGIERRFTRISDMEDEISMSRIYGGVHFRSSNEAGSRLGRRVAELAMQRLQ